MRWWYSQAVPGYIRAGAPLTAKGAPASIKGCNRLHKSVSGKPCQAFLLVVVLVLVLGFSGFFDYEHEDDDENEPSPASSRYAL